MKHFPACNSCSDKYTAVCEYCTSTDRAIRMRERAASDFVDSAIIGAVTGSAVVGGLVGGDLIGGILGDALFGDDDIF